MKNLIVIMTALALSGCVAARITAPGCDAQSIDFGSVPSIPANTLPNVSVPVTLPPQSISIDYSDYIKKVDSVSKNLQVDITKLVIQSTGDGGNDLAWVRSVDVKIIGSDPNGSTPMATLGTADSSLNVKVTMSDAEVLHYLSSGKVTLTITISGVVTTTTLPQGELTDSVNLCLAVSGDVKESL